jgi:hypothetical protein
MARPKHFDDYADMTEIVPGVFIVPGDGVYIVDDIGEVCCWVASEWQEDPEAATATAYAVALAASMGANAVRRNLESGGKVIEGLIDRTYKSVYG